MVHGYLPKGVDPTHLGACSPAKAETPLCSEKLQAMRSILRFYLSAVNSMNHLFFTFIAVAVTLMLSISTASGTDLTPYRWQNRLLLVFSPTDSDTDFENFNRALSDELLEVNDRDLIVIRVFEKGLSRLGEQPMSPEDAETLRRRFGVESGRFTLVLVGKDGGVKLVRQDRAELREVFDRIDSMPMRRREMREKDQNR